MGIIGLHEIFTPGVYYRNLPGFFEVMASVSGRHLWESESENWSYKLKDILISCQTAAKKNDITH